MGVFLGDEAHSCLPPRTSPFSSPSATGCAHSFSNRRVTHGFTGGNRAAFKPPPLKATIFGNTWRLGEKIHVHN